MTAGAAIFLAVAWSAVTGLAIFCVWRVLRSKRS